jgi:hypothetical protein
MDKPKQKKRKWILRVGIILMLVSIMLLCYLSKPIPHEIETYPLSQDVYATEVLP